MTAHRKIIVKSNHLEIFQNCAFAEFDRRGGTSVKFGPISRKCTSHFRSLCPKYCTGLTFTINGWFLNRREMEEENA